MHRVFISSTSKDLTIHREAVRDAVLRLGMHPVMMEHFPAMDANALEACKRKLLDCDLFVGIYAHRYGYVPAGHTQSITELEYEWAKEGQMPRHLFVVKPSYEWPAEFTDAPDDHAKLDAFKKRIGIGHVWSEFTTPDSLAAAVTQSLVHDAEKLSREQVKQRRLVILGVMAIAVLIIGVIAAVILSQPDEEKIGISQADRAATNEAIAQANASATATLWTPTPTATNTFTPSPTFTPTNTPTPTATPLEGTVAGEGETLLLIADFTYIDADATRIEPNLEREFENSGIRYIRIRHPIANRDEAREILDLYKATLILWGAAARGGVQVEFEATAVALNYTPVRFDQVQVAAPDVTSFDAYIFEGMDTRYIVEFTLGRMYLSNENYADAITAFHHAEAMIPEGRANDVQAEWLYMLLGWAFEHIDRLEEALAQYDTAATLTTDWGGPLVLGAGAAMHLSDFSGALRRANEAFALGLENPMMEEQNAAEFIMVSYIVRATAILFLDRMGNSEVEVQQAKDDIDAALELGQSLRADDPTYPLSHLYVERATIWEAIGDTDAALADFETALAETPDDAGIYVLRGFLYQRMGQSDAAIADFSQAITLDATNATAYRSRGSVYIDLGEWDLALADVNRSIELDPTYGLTYGYRATIAVQLGDYEAVITDLTTELSLVPDFTNEEKTLIYVVRGAAALQLGRYEDALDDLSAAIEFNNTHALAYYFRAQLYVDQFPDCEKASADYEQYTALGQTDADLASDIAALCNPPTPTPPPAAAPDPRFENGASVTLTSPLPLVMLAEPNLAAAQVGVCTAGTAVTIQQTVLTTDGRRWVSIDCLGVVGWVEENKLPNP